MDFIKYLILVTLNLVVPNKAYTYYVINGDSDNTDTDDSHGDDLEVYSSFSSGFQLLQAPFIT